MSAIERDEHSGGARDATTQGPIPAFRIAPLRSASSPSSTRSRRWCPICQQAAGHATRCTQGQHPDRRAVACESRQRLHIRSPPPEREWWNSGKRMRPRVRHPGQSSPAAETRQKGRDRPPSVPRPSRFRGKCGSGSLGDRPRQEQHCDWTGRLPGNPARQHDLGTLAGQRAFLYVRISSQIDKRTQPDGRSN